MTTDKNDRSDFVKKFEKGLELSKKRLIKEKAASDGYLVYQKDGKIVKVKAKDI